MSDKPREFKFSVLTEPYGFNCIWHSPFPHEQGDYHVIEKAEYDKLLEKCAGLERKIGRLENYIELLNNGQLVINKADAIDDAEKKIPLPLELALWATGGRMRSTLASNMIDYLFPCK